MRFAKILALATMAVCALLSSAPVFAQDADPQRAAVRTCMAAYEAAAALGRQEENLLKFIPNAAEAARQFSQRADRIAERAKASGMVKGVDDPAFVGRLDGAKWAEELASEGIFASSNAVLAPERIFVRQRQVLAQVRSCDQNNGFTPVLDEPRPQADIIAYYAAGIAKKVEERKTRLAGLDDLACATRFYLFAVTNQAMAAEMQRRTVAVMPKVQATMPGVTEAAVGTALRRGAETINSKMKTQADVDAFIEEINECERRYGMSLTRKQ